MDTAFAEYVERVRAQRAEMRDSMAAIEAALADRDADRTVARRRLRALALIGAGVVAGSIAMLVLLREGRDIAESRAAERGLAEPAAAAIWDTLTRDLVEQTWILLGAAVVVWIVLVVGRRIVGPSLI